MKNVNVTVSIRQIRSVRQTLMSDTVISQKSMLIINRPDYCNSILFGAYGIHLWQLQGKLCTQRCGEVNS